jgi:tetratricopeptide (TPR) repeat protein
MPGYGIEKRGWFAEKLFAMTNMRHHVHRFVDRGGDMNTFNQGNGNMEVEIDACDIKRPRKTAPRRAWLAGMFVALLLVADYGFGETGSGEITRQDAAPDARKQAAALFGKGETLKEQGKTGEALAVYEEIDRRFSQDTSPDVRMLVALALFSKGATLGEQGKTGESLAVYEEIDRRFGQDTSPDVRAWVVLALLSKGLTLGQQGKTGEALVVYEEIERRFSQDTSPGMREKVAAALLGKGAALREQGKIGEALAVYEEIDRRFGQDASPDVRKLVVSVLANEAARLFEFHNDAADALAVLDSVLARCGNSPGPALQAECFRALKNSVEPLLVLEKPSDAAQKIRQVQAQLAADDGESAIMAFLLWLAKPQTSEQTVRKAIRALPPDAQFDWTFNGIRPFVLALPAPRKAQGQCFLDFFEQHHDAEKLDVCLDKTGSLP